MAEAADIDNANIIVNKQNYSSVEAAFKLLVKTHAIMHC
jgi:hypothetical protein